MTPLIVSADDFGLHEPGDAAILELARQQRLSATSCLVLSPRWPAAARNLTRDVRQCVDVGLHLDFTEFAAPLSLPRLICTSGLRRLDPRTLRDRIARQCDAFERAAGTPPDYVDGHQHVHQLPQIREALLDELDRRYATRPWLRISNPAPGHGLKGRIVRGLGARALRDAAARRGFPHSQRLHGVYDFDLAEDRYRLRLMQWLRQIRAGDALMIHPAAAIEPRDPIGHARVTEYRVLRSAWWPDTLRSLSIVPTRGSRVLKEPASPDQLRGPKGGRAP